MRLYGRPVSYHLRQSAAGEGLGNHAHWPSLEEGNSARWPSLEEGNSASWPSLEEGTSAHWFSLVQGNSAQWPSQLTSQEEASFFDKETGDDSYLGQEEYVDSIPVENSIHGEEWADGTSYPDLDWVHHSYPDLGGVGGVPEYRQQVLVGRSDVTFPLIPYWTTDRVDQSLVWLTFLTVFLVVFIVALMLGWCLHLLAKALRRRSQVNYEKKTPNEKKCNSHVFTIAFSSAKFFSNFFFIIS